MYYGLGRGGCDWRHLRRLGRRRGRGGGWTRKSLEFLNIFLRIWVVSGTSRVRWRELMRLAGVMCNFLSRESRLGVTVAALAAHM